MLEIEPARRIEATVAVPGSKSFTQRALAVSALAEGRSLLRNALASEDTAHMVGALRDFGAEILETGGDVIVTGTGGRLDNPCRPIYLGNNGTAMRFLTALAALGKGSYVLTGDRRLCERPLKPLLAALGAMGIRTGSVGVAGFPPVVVEAGALSGGALNLGDIESSQYLSALLICAPYARQATTIDLRGAIPSRPYVDMTLAVMGHFGAEVKRESDCRWRVGNASRYRGRRYRIESDASSAAYFFLAAALCGGTVRVEGIRTDSRQGDIRFLDILGTLGCAVESSGEAVEVTGGVLRGGDRVFDMGDMPDMVPTLAVLAALRRGRTVITKAAHLRLKESDRLAAVAAELRRVGVAAEERPDGLWIEGGNPRGAEITTYNDHRIAMSFAVLGLAVPGMKIRDPQCVGKSFPGFWRALKGLVRP